MKLLVKLGGTLLDVEETREALARQIAAISRDVSVVVVHGGGRQMTRFLTERGIESQFVNGLRITTPAILEAVVQVVAGKVNSELVASLNRAGARAVGLSGIDGGLVEAEQMDPSLGSVGRVIASDPAVLHLLLGGGFLPVVACVAGDRGGRLYNVNADQLAAACAAAFGADLLVFLTDVEGVLDGEKRLAPHLTLAGSESLMASGVATGGMLAKLNAAHSALRQGVPEVRIAGGASCHILERILAGEDAGTRIAGRGGLRQMISGLTADAVLESTASPRDLVVRKAGMHDIAPILDLINGYAAKGIMLARTEFEVSEDIRDFTVILSGGRLLGCGALHFYTPTIGEIRSLAVAESAKTQGIGRRLIEALAREASGYSLDAIFAFTYVAEFFRKMGFEEVDRGELPLKVWKDCVRCSKFQCCDEIAVIRILKPENRREFRQHSGGENTPLIQLPVLRRA